MQVQVTTRLLVRPKRARKGNIWPLLVVDLDLVPRGGGNRRAAERLAARWRGDKTLSDFIEKIVVGTSKVRVHLTACPELDARIEEERRREREGRDVPGQLPLFAV